MLSPLECKSRVRACDALSRNLIWNLYFGSRLATYHLLLYLQISLHLTSLHLTMQERLSIIYVGDSEADEFAIRMLKGVAFTFRVTNEDSEAITKTSADYWIAGEEKEDTCNLMRDCASHSC